MSNPMSIVPPEVGVTTGPEWAEELNLILTDQVATHKHTGQGDGDQIGADSLNIQSELNLNNNKLGGTKEVDLTAQASVLTTGAVYRLSDDLYYRDGSGNQVRITQGGAVVGGGGGTGNITGLTAPAEARYTALNGAFSWKINTAPNQYARMENANIRVYNGASPAPTGYVQIVSPITNTSTPQLTLPTVNVTLPTALPAGADNELLEITSAGVIQQCTFNRSLANFFSTTSLTAIDSVIGSTTFVSTGKPFIIVIESLGGTLNYSGLYFRNTLTTPNTEISAFLTIRVNGVAGNGANQRWTVYDPIPSTSAGSGIYTNAQMSWIYPNNSKLTSVPVEIRGQKGGNGTVQLQNYCFSIYEINR